MQKVARNYEIKTARIVVGTKQGCMPKSSNELGKKVWKKRSNELVNKVCKQSSNVQPKKVWKQSSMESGNKVCKRSARR